MIKFTKLSVLVLLFVMLQIPLKAQYLRIVGDTLLSYEANINETYEIFFTTQIQNIGFANLNVRIKVKVLEMTEGHSFDICWAGGCLPPATSDWDKSPSVVVKGGETLPTNAFYSHYYPYSGSSDAKIGSGKLIYTFYDADNPDDNASATVSFKYYDGMGIVETPMSEAISIDLNDNNSLNIKVVQNDTYFISIYNIDGNLIFLRNFNSDTQIDLNPYTKGVYVFSVMNSSSKKVTTGKLIKR